MFDSPHYATRGVMAEVPLEIQLILWSLIDQSKEAGIQLDYLQVFELTIDCAFGEMLQRIIHRQEVPPYTSESFYHSISIPISRTIWIIDSGDHSTMLFPEEY